jgi:hypothetical protein
MVHKVLHRIPYFLACRIQKFDYPSSINTLLLVTLVLLKIGLRLAVIYR